MTFFGGEIYFDQSCTEDGIAYFVTNIALCNLQVFAIFETNKRQRTSKICYSRTIHAFSDVCSRSTYKVRTKYSTLQSHSEKTLSILNMLAVKEKQ